MNRHALYENMEKSYLIWEKSYLILVTVYPASRAVLSTWLGLGLGLGFGVEESHLVRERSHGLWLFFCPFLPKRSF